MQYSLRTRRRLRPTTGDQTRAAAAATAVVEQEIADGTGATRRPLLTGAIVERVLPRAITTAFRR
jgi:hypothetical protein